MIGTWHRMAVSCARRIFLIVSGHHEPAFTVASFATTTASRPPPSPPAATHPAAGAPGEASLVVEQGGDPRSRSELALLVLPLDLVGPSPLLEPRLELAKLTDQ